MLWIKPIAGHIGEAKYAGNNHKVRCNVKGIKVDYKVSFFLHSQLKHFCAWILFLFVFCCSFIILFYLSFGWSGVVVQFMGGGGGWGEGYLGCRKFNFCSFSPSVFLSLCLCLSFGGTGNAENVFFEKNIDRLKNARIVQIHKAYLYFDILADFTNFNWINHKWYILKEWRRKKTPQKWDYRRIIYIYSIINRTYLDKKIKLTNKKTLPCTKCS